MSIGQFRCIDKMYIACSQEIDSNFDIHSWIRTDVITETSKTSIVNNLIAISNFFSKLMSVNIKCH